MKIEIFDALGAKVTGYIHEDHDRLVEHKTRPALILCPGGAYRFTSPREADPVALEWSVTGYNVFILDYAVLKNAKNYLPLRQLAETVHHVRANAEKWHIRKDRVAVLGFSAGGHLVASLGALWNDASLGLPEDCRPDALVLGYPVITLGKYTHQESCDNVTGGDEKVRKALMLEERVGPQMPPTFVWHTVDDPSVPVQNTLLLVNALQEAGVPYECHLFAHGDHGISVCTQEVETPNPACAPWVQLSKTWLNGRFGYTP